MTKGRKPKPVEVKRREGNPGKRALPDVVTVAGRGLPDKPVGLSDLAGSLWDVEVPKMAADGLLDQIDGPVLGQYFEAWGLAIGSIKAVYGDDDTSDLLKGPVTWTPNDFTGELTAKKHPGITAWKDATATMQRIAAEFGLTPSSRTRLGMSGAAGASPLAVDGEIGASPRLRIVE